jgi:hypothetical protein
VHHFLLLLLLIILCRPGGALVAEGVSPTDAHLDLHFRLTHHDLLADLIDAVGSMKDAGGIAGLDARKVRWAAHLGLDGLNEYMSYAWCVHN